MCENCAKQADFSRFFKLQEIRNQYSDEQSSHPPAGRLRRSCRRVPCLAICRVVLAQCHKDKEDLPDLTGFIAHFSM
jgi:hypothetical protein